MRQLFLPAGLVLAAALALILPAPGAYLSARNGIQALICIIFLVSGLQTGTKGIPLDARLLRILLSAAAVSLLVSPLLGLGLTKLITLPGSLVIGLTVTCAVPPTLSSGIVLTEVSRGNTVLALLLTISLNLTGIFTLPFMLDLCLSAGDQAAVDRMGLLVKMLLLVLLPFGIGRTIRAAADLPRVSPDWSYVNSSCVILAVYASLAVSGKEFLATDPHAYMVITACAGLIHFLLLALNALIAKALRLNPADRNALVLVASQKTLPVSLAVLAGFNRDTGNAVIVCLIFHFLQLFADSMLAPYLARPLQVSLREETGRHEP